MSNNSKIGNYYRYIANEIAKAYDFPPIIIMLTILFTLQILKPVDLNHSDSHMDELCSSKKVSSITNVSDQLKCIEYDINKKIKNILP